MLNSKEIRELAYLVKIDAIKPMDADRLEIAVVGGWECVVGKDEFNAGDIAVYFETDSKLPDIEPFSSMEFLKSKHFKIKIQKIRGVYSQGLLAPLTAVGWTLENEFVVDKEGGKHRLDDDTRFVTNIIGVTYASAADNTRKGKSNIKDMKYRTMCDRRKKLASKRWFKWFMKRKWGRELMFAIFGKKKYVAAKAWPDGKFAGVARTDQNRVENVPFVLSMPTRWIRSEKCDGSSATYILERKKFGKFEFYVCSRNVRMLNPNQTCFFGDKNYYWEVAEKYDIEKKMKAYMAANPKCKFVCWQGEICAPGIQKNPHNLKETHFYCFHWTDSERGRLDLREAANEWASFSMETVPINFEEVTLPQDMETFKLEADGYYSASCCEGQDKQPREGFVYYKADEPTYSFKNVSRKYLMRHANDDEEG